MTTIDRCREFYINTIAPAIHREFPDCEGRIAAGLAGEGSECFGFDDDYSRDHDFAISICLWLTDEDHRVIGDRLEEIYRRLAEDCEAGTRLEYRRGVQRISDFYQNILGFTFDTGTPELTDAQWFCAEDWKLAAAVNGEVFRDDCGRFSRVRELIRGYYPERIFRMKLTNALHGYAGSIQANYPRCMARGDHVAAHACVSRGIEEAMRIAFMLCRRYMPYYKWSYRALKELASGHSGEAVTAGQVPPHALAAFADLIGELSLAAIDLRAWDGFAYDGRRLNTADDVVRLSEEIAAVLADMLYGQGLTDSRETFLEVHCEAVSRGVR